MAGGGRQHPAVNMVAAAMAVTTVLLGSIAAAVAQTETCVRRNLLEVAEEQRPESDGESWIVPALF